jgi:hypothetical protein
LTWVKVGAVAMAILGLLSTVGGPPGSAWVLPTPYFYHDL